MTQFAFLQPEWPEVAAAASRAEALAHPDPRAACFYARRAIELLVHWAYKFDSALKLPYQDNLQALLHEPTFIDVLLKEAGWPLVEARDREFEVAGMPNEEGQGYVDYVLWGDDGKPLGIVEAKRTRRDPTVGQQQAKLYADCLEKQFGQRPLVFYANGYVHWYWTMRPIRRAASKGFSRRTRCCSRSSAGRCGSCWRLPTSMA
jgi:type I restriction enzyme R subunit